MIVRDAGRGAVGFLSRLRKDVRGNTLALAAAALIPMLALVGGGVDLSRIYLIKARLQHACDAGTLAGRKAMGAGTWAQTSPSPLAIANQFFDGNFKSGAYSTTGISRNFTENDGRVSGVASVTVPMTIMTFFGSPTRKLTVYCDAQEQIPNTDVMFVLDTTGSMACNPNGNNCNSGSSSKIAVLRNSVKCFYEAVTQLTTNGNCSDSNSSGAGINSSSQIRFGFVPYSMNVNVGRLLLTSWVADNWKYQSRQQTWTAYANTSPAIACANMPANSTTTQYQKVTSGGTCTVQSRTAIWAYGQFAQDISGLKNGTAWKSGTTAPIGDGFTTKTVAWDGCIEERPNVGSGGTYTAMPTTADIDTVPSTGDANSYWAPALPGMIFFRTMIPKNNSPYYGGTADSSASTSTTNYLNGDDTVGQVLYDCPAASQKLQVWSTSTFDNYVDSLSASGNTFHDIGMLWGGRLISPNGLFQNENKLTPAGGTIQRNMTSMTDGDAQASPCNYMAYGVPYYDKRQTTDAGTGNQCVSEYQNLDNQVNNRLAALCTLVKNEGVNLYVISFGGTGIAADTKARLQTCATDTNHYFDATNATQLQSAFSTIAAQITQLRLVK